MLLLECNPLTATISVPNMFSTGGSKQHSIRKRMLSHVYSKSYIQSSASLSAMTNIILYRRLLPSLYASVAKNSGIVNIYAVLSAVTMDIVTGYLFGLSASSNLTEDRAARDHFLHLYNCRRSFNFWPQEYPRLTAFMQKLGAKLSPDFVADANREIEAWCLSMCDSASITLKQAAAANVDVPMQDQPVVYARLRSDLQKEAVKSKESLGLPGMEMSAEQLRLEAASEMLDHLAAGFDTSGITLTYLVHELSLREDVQSSLRNELRSLDPPLVPSPVDKEPRLSDSKTLDSLPLLHAVVWETLRLHSAIPGPQPRVTPPSGCRLGPDPGYFVPGGVRVSASAGILHGNQEVFDKSETWNPQRWLEAEGEQRKEMDRWFWAFGSGGRMCVGSNLAIYRTLCPLNCAAV